MTDEEIDDMYRRWPEMTKQETVEAAYEMTGGNLQDLSDEKLARLHTVATYVFDLTLNELERRGLIPIRDGAPVIPYISEHSIETILTRE
jgi:hypothetical protein